MPLKTQPKSDAKNVLGGPLKSCSKSPMAGFERQGSCHSGSEDTGSHVVCASLTQEFLDYTAAQGNDLSTPRPEWDFPGLKAGDSWCLCAARWKEALKAGVAPKVFLESTHEKALFTVSKVELEAHAFSK
jgi:uncharacterized protein